ncbi:MAG TPA: cell wall-active antibiotics response protein LiaF [Anaerolineaceae bacterium]|nr:cell wall-active antibiotics response protein LiaF [Anaerolineaceae bacterium]
MRNRPQLIIGAVLVIWGILALLETVFHINFWAICWPTLFILVGIWLIFRPRMVSSGTGVEMRIIGDIRRTGFWQVIPAEFWTGIGNIDLDFSSAEIPTGETTLRMYGLIGDVDLVFPPEVGLAVSTGGFVVTTKILGNKQDSILAPVEYTSPDYSTAERKIRLVLIYFIADLDIRVI